MFCHKKNANFDKLDMFTKGSVRKFFIVVFVTCYLFVSCPESLAWHLNGKFAWNHGCQLVDYVGSRAFL